VSFLGVSTYVNGFSWNFGRGFALMQETVSYIFYFVGGILNIGGFAHQFDFYCDGHSQNY